MTRYPTSVFLAATGVGLLGLLLVGNIVGSNGQSVLPLLARLAISELGFIICTIGAFLGCRADWGNCRPSINSIAAMTCFVLAIVFAFSGFQLWPM